MKGKRYPWTTLGKYPIMSWLNFRYGGCCHLPTPPRFGMLGPEIVLQGTRYAEIFRFTMFF
ncbi:hypothetical protein NC651_031521 [Populus alba x Populus x berolinensis]|nr:hypothetical protein NC651_031521 [Populus alba x Populus x berolinensis]